MPSLLASFDEDVDPGFYVVRPFVPPVATPGGQSTRDSDAPRQHVKVPFSTWNAIAKVALDDVRERRHFANDQSPKWNSGRYIEVEGDVAEAASLYLLYAVDIVLYKYLASASVRFLSQHTIFVDNHTVRADRVWAMGVYQSLDLPAYFAVLDFKRPRLINPADFGVPITWSAYESNPIDVLEPVAFTRNALILLKQAVNYSHRYKTKFIAFFDWDTLVLVVLADAQNGSGGEYCFVTIVTDRKKMRRALLGFLIRAQQARTAMVEAYPDLEGSDSSRGKRPNPGKDNRTGFSRGGGGESSRHSGR